MPLFIGGQALAVPHHGNSANAEELFGEICGKFRISDKIGKFLASDEGLANLDDFVHRFASEDEISTFVKAIPELRFPVHVEPGDQLVSRLAREVSRRQLGVFSVWKVRTLVHQLKAPCKRQRLSDTVEMITHERPRSAPAPRLAARCRGAGTTAQMSRRGHFRLTSPGITL